MSNIDLLIHARWIFPIAPENTVLENHALAVHEGKIIDLLPIPAAKEQYYAAEYLELKNHVLMPGFVNSHTHAPMNLFRGLADDLDLMDWLNNHIWPAEQKIINPESIRAGTRLALAEMIRSGTTCFNDHYFFAREIAKATADMGMRARVGLHIFNTPTLWAKDEHEGITKCEAILEEGYENPLTSWAMAVHATYTIGDEGLAAAKRMSDKYDIPVHMHMHETTAEIQMELERSNQRPLERLDNDGLLNDKFIAVHMVHLNDEDLKRVSDSGCHIVLCPDSNLKLASGFPEIHKIMEATNNIAIGTDSAASNNDLDIMAEMRLASMIAKAGSKDAKLMPADEALYIATMGGAKAMHLDKEIGSLEKGKMADMIAIDLDHLFTTPTFDPMSQIVYSANRLQVSDVWVAGNRLLKENKLTKVNEKELVADATKWIEQAAAFGSHNLNKKPIDTAA